MPNCSSFGALQENMFKVAGVPMVENCIAGYNSCMFAYGQVSYRFHLLLQILNFFGCHRFFIILCLPFNAWYLLLLDWQWKNTYNAW